MGTCNSEPPRGALGRTSQDRRKQQKWQECDGVVLYPEGGGEQHPCAYRFQRHALAAFSQQKVTAENEEHQESFRLARVPVARPDVHGCVHQDSEERLGLAEAPFRKSENADRNGQQPENVQQPDAPHRGAEDLHYGCVQIKNTGWLVVPEVAIESRSVEQATPDHTISRLVAPDGVTEIRNGQQQDQPKRQRQPAS